MTNLTSEQFRDVLKHVENATEKIPSVQHLLRRAVEMFYNRFKAYPEMAGVAPGKVSILGEQTQFDGGLSMPTATPMATIVVGRRAQGPRFTVVTSADVGKPHKVTFSFSRNRPLAPGCPQWLNYVKGVIDKFPEAVPAFDAAIESSLPIGVGFGSSAALEVAVYTFLEVLVGRKSAAVDKAIACQAAEKEFAFKEVGLADRIASILARDRNLMLVDGKTNEVQWLPFESREVAFVAIDSHERDTVFGNEYPERSRYLKKACQMLKVNNLREFEGDALEALEEEIRKRLDKPEGEEDEEEKEEPEEWTQEEFDVLMKRVRFYQTEMQRITEAVQAWDEGDVDTFGKIMQESHKSLQEDFDFRNPLLNFLVQTSLQVEGVLGSRMTGMGLGFGGGIVSLIKKENIERYCNFVSEKLAEFGDGVYSELHNQRSEDKKKRVEVRRRVHSEHYNPAIASSEKIGQVQEYMERGGEPRKMSSAERERRSSVREKRAPCIVKVDKPPGGCGTWARYQKTKDKEEFLRKASQEEEKEEEEEEKKEAGVGKGSLGNGDRITGSEGSGVVSEASAIQRRDPTFYIVSPFPGARMMFVTKADLLRSLYAVPVPHPKALMRTALREFNDEFGTKPEAIGVAPGSLTLFGEFMEFHLGYIVCMAVSMMTVTVGGRNDSVYFSMKTTLEQADEPHVMKTPLPCVRSLDIDARDWVNYVSGTVNEFKGHVPGFNAVIHSSVPIQAGVNSCAALQASVYTFLERLTNSCTLDPFEKADRCGKSEYEFQPAPSELVSRCSTLKFFPTFLCKEGHLMLVNCKRYKISHYLFDHPSYVFLVAVCKKNTTSVTVETLDEKLKLCAGALDLLGRNSLLNADTKHLRCLRKRDGSEEMVRCVRYVMTEHQRTVQVVKAIKMEDYERVGFLMSQSHASLRDDYQVSSPEIEQLVRLAKEVDGVLGAKMLGRGLTAAIIILARMNAADDCIRYVRKNYKPKWDKPVFYLTKPSSGAFMMHPDTQLPIIP